VFKAENDKLKKRLAELLLDPEPLRVMGKY
jgi:hypothetical protein